MGKLEFYSSGDPWKKHTECTSKLSLHRLSSWDNYCPLPIFPPPICWELSLGTLPSSHFWEEPECEVSGLQWMWRCWQCALNCPFDCTEIRWSEAAGSGAQKVSATACLRSNQILGIFSLLEKVRKRREEKAPLALSPPRETKNVRWRPGSLLFIPSSGQHHGTLRNAPSIHEH